MLNHSGSVPQVPTILKISFLILAVCFSIFIIFAGFVSADTGYQPIITFDPSLSATVFATDGTTTMDVKFTDGRLYVSDSVHGVKNLRVLESMLVNRLDGYNGKEVLLYHVNDVGVSDSSRLVQIQSDGTWTYFYDVEFSEIIIDGFVGTWEVTAYNLSVSDSLNFGQTFNASNVKSLPVNATDDATKSNPYDINTTGLVGWWKLDDDYLDSSGNGNNGTAYGDTHFVHMKYDNGSSFDGNGDYVSINTFDINTTAFSISICINSTSLTGCPVVINKWGAAGNRMFKFVASLNGNKKPYFDVSPNGITDVYINSNTTIELNKFYNIVGVYNGNSQTLKIYINGIDVSGALIGSVPNEVFVSSSNIEIANMVSANNYFSGTIDNAMIFNYSLSESEITNLYYDHLQQLQIKTNSNSTWSSEWNSSADNPIQVPYADGEFFSLLNFTVPETVTQNGITIYDYPSTVRFDAVATVGYTEDITKITEDATAGTYTLNVTHAAGNTGEGYINYTTANSVLLDADFWNAAVLTTDNPNASLSTTLPYFNISTGYVAAATEFYYLIEMSYFYPPTNIQTTPSQTWVNISWDAVPNADKYSIYELEDGFPYVDTNPTIDGVKDAIYDCAHEFLIFSPNPFNPGDYEPIYPLRTSLGAYFLIESVDNDDKSGDDDTIYYFDPDNNGLTVDDPAWKITNNIVKKYLWDGDSWQVTGVSDAVGASTGGGTHYPIHELFIPIAELGANWTNGSTVKVLVKREDSSLSPDVVTWYPYGNINDTDTSLWQEMVLNDPESYILLDNTTNLWYNATGLTPFTIYHGAVSAWNGTTESNYTLFDVITEDLPTYTVSGTVSDTDGNPIANAIVFSCNGFVHEITTTNVSGYWVGYNFREDNYTICANKAGYYGNSIDIFVDSNLTNQNITLTAEPVVIVSKYQKIGEMLFAIPTILKLVLQKIADVIPIIFVLAFIMLIINIIGIVIHAIRVWR